MTHGRTTAKHATRAARGAYTCQKEKEASGRNERFCVDRGAPRCWASSSLRVILGRSTTATPRHRGDVAGTGSAPPAVCLHAARAGETGHGTSRKYHWSFLSCYSAPFSASAPATTGRVLPPVRPPARRAPCFSPATAASLARLWHYIPTLPPPRLFFLLPFRLQPTTRRAGRTGVRAPCPGSYRNGGRKIHRGGGGPRGACPPPNRGDGPSRRRGVTGGAGVLDAGPRDVYLLMCVGRRRRPGRKPLHVALDEGDVARPLCCE